MKKIISLVLSVSIVLTLFTVIPVIASSTPTITSAEQNPPKILTEIDFDFEASGGYSTEYFIEEGQDRLDAGMTPFKEVNGNNVYAVYTTCGGHDNATRGYALRNSKSADNEALKLTDGKYYKISLDYKNIKTSSRWHRIGVIWVDNPKNFTHEKLKSQFVDGKHTTFETFPTSSTELEWKTASGIITPPDNTNVYPVLVAYNYGLTLGGSVEILFDNICVSEYEFKTSNYIDFDYEATNGYNYYYEETKPETQVPRSLTNLNDGTHNNVFSIGLTGSTIAQRTYAIREDGTDTPLPLEFGKEYTIELCFKNKKSQADYSISIAWVEDPSIVALAGLPNIYKVGTKVLNNPSVPASYIPVNDCPYIVDIATNIPGGQSERDWVKVKSTITPYSSKKMYPVLLVRSSQTSLLEWQAIYFDDITITANTEDEVTYIDFDTEANGDYSTEYFIEEGQDRLDKGMTPFKEVNGNNVYAVYTTCGGHDNATRGYALRNSKSADNEALKLTYGKNYKISLDYKNIKTSSRWHCIGVIWVDNPKNFTHEKLKSQFVDGKHTTFETFSQSSTELEWKTASGIITPPDETNVYPVLVAYNYGLTLGGSVEILFDNICVKEYEFKTSNHIDFNYEAEENDYRYYLNEGRTDRPATFQTLSDDEHKNVFHVGVTLTSGTHRVYAIREEGTADPLPLEYGSNYDIKLYYKNVSTKADYNISIAWVDNPSIAAITGVPGDYTAAGAVRTNESIPPSYNPINTSENAGLYVQKISEDITKSNSEGEWTEISGTITPPDNKRIYPIVLVRPVNNGTNVVESIYLDDISLQLSDDNKTDETEIDFDLEADGKYTYYSGGGSYTEYPAFKNINDNSHKNVYSVYTTKQSSKSAQKSYLLRNSTSVLNAPLELKYSQNYEISIDYKNISTNGTYYVAIDWVSDPDSVKSNYQPQNIDTLEVIAPTDDNRDNWRTIKQIITPPDSENLYPVLFVYSNKTQENILEIYFDNISVKRTEESSISAQYDTEIKVDFDTGSQPEFYGETNNDFTYRLYNEEGSYWTDKYEGNGVSAVFDRYCSSTSAKDNPVAVTSIRTIGLCNTEGTRFANLESGAVVDISLDINIVKSVEKSFYVGLAFADTTNETASAIGGYRQYGGLYNISSNGMLCDIANVDATVSNWQTITGRIVVPEHTKIETAWLVLYRKDDFGSMYSRGQEIYIDNITANVVGKAHCMQFNTNGGSDVKNLYYLEGDDTVIPPVSTREGYEFDGWYYDSEFTQRYDYNSKMPDYDITLYANWMPFPAGLRATSLKTSFEKSDYNGGNIPYTNVYKNGEINPNNVADNVNSKTVTVYYDSAISAKTGSGYIEFENKKVKNGESSIPTNSAALLNPDGSNYYIVKGNRYRIKYAIRAHGTDSRTETFATPVINLVVSGLTPSTGLGMKSATALDRFNYHPKSTSDDTIARESLWVYHEAYFEATETGKAYLIMFDDTFSNHTTVMIDDLEIVPESDEPISKVTYKSYNGSKTYGTSMGCYGTAIKAEYLADVRSGYVFDGWRKEDGSLFTFDKFPNGDITLIASYKESEVTDGQAVINWDNPITTDFENSDLAKTFYLDKRNVSNAQSVGLNYVTGDSVNAHSGSSYFKFQKIQGDYQFKVYAENTPDNYIWLDAKSEYLVTYYVNVTDMPAAYRARFTVGTFNSVDSAGGFTAAETYDYLFSGERNNWIKVQQRITTDDSQRTLGIRVSGGPVTALIDDVTVTKLGIVTIKFNSNGGSAVEDIELASFGYAIEPDYPTKEGYVFAGWYLDAELKNQFKFNETAIEKDITLYAKWVLPEETLPDESLPDEETQQPEEENATPEKKYKTVYETEYVEETVQNDLSEYGLYDVPAVGKTDIPTESNDYEEEPEKTQFPWWIIIVIAAILVIISVVITIIIKLRKRRGNVKEAV